MGAALRNMTNSPVYLNLGCGSRYHRAWVNVDLAATDPSIISHDLRRRLPFADDSCDVVYRSHVLEHFQQADGARFLRECFRVCKPGGVIRVVVPDLEAIARLYLHYLELAKNGDPLAAERYSWMLLELYDQTVRIRSGGQIAIEARRLSANMADFVRTRLGETQLEGITKSQQIDTSMWNRLRRVLNRPGGWWNRLRLLLTQVMLIAMWGGTGRQMAELLRVRTSGEIHQWMYDQFSLSKALSEAGFQDINVCSANESRIEGWLGFCLDVDVDGKPYKPDSLYCEARKPLFDKK